MNKTMPFILVLMCFISGIAKADSFFCESDWDYMKPPLAADEYEAKIHDILKDITENQNYYNVPEQDARMYRILAESVNAQNIVEIGTSTGYSTIWFGLALKQTGGKLTTFEIDPERSAIARENFKRAEMNDIITLIEGDAHEEVLKLSEPIDILFLDADKKGYIDYLNKLLPLVREGGLIIGDNIMTDLADPVYVEAITTNPALETVVIAGVAYTIKKRSIKN